MANSRQWFNNVVLNNWTLKLLAVILAMLSFYAIRGAISFEVPYDIPLEVDVDKPGIAVLDQPETVKITFRGSREDLAKLDQKQIRVIVKPEVSDPAGTETVKIGRGDITGASGVIVEKIDPAQVTLRFDQEIPKKFSVVRPKTRGMPLRGKIELDWTPTSVVVSGSKRRLEEVGKLVVETEPVNVDGRVESFTERVRVLPPSDTGVWKIEPPEVTVKVSIVTETISREWTNITVLAIIEHGSKMVVNFEPAMVNVSLSGRAEAVDGIAEQQVKVFVDCVGLKAPGNYELPVDVHLPTGKDINAAVTPEMVKVSLKLRQVE